MRNQRVELQDTVALRSGCSPHQCTENPSTWAKEKVACWCVYLISVALFPDMALCNACHSWIYFARATEHHSKPLHFSLPCLAKAALSPQCMHRFLYVCIVCSMLYHKHPSHKLPFEESQEYRKVPPADQSWNSAQGHWKGKNPRHLGNQGQGTQVTLSRPQDSPLSPDDKACLQVCVCSPRRSVLCHTRIFIFLSSIIGILLESYNCNSWFKGLV